MTSPMHLQPGESIQRNQTVYRVFRDQHGREFGAQSDIRNNQPKEELRPVNDDPRNVFNPPWLPPMRFAKWRRAGDLDFKWDYETMAAELSGDTTSYYTDAIKLAIEINKPEPELGGPVHPHLRMVLGRPPLSPAIPLAAAQGDPWILGIPGAPINTFLKQVLEQGVGASSKETLAYIRDKVMGGMTLRVPEIERPEDVTPKARTINDAPDVADLPDLTYQDFVRECRGQKLSLVEIGRLWEQHKARMAENATASVAAV